MIEELRDIFGSIACLSVEGPEVCARVELMEAISKKALKGYNLCSELIQKEKEKGDD